MDADILQVMWESCASSDFCIQMFQVLELLFRLIRVIAHSSKALAAPTMLLVVRWRRGFRLESLLLLFYLSCSNQRRPNDVVESRQRYGLRDQQLFEDPSRHLERQVGFHGKAWQLVVLGFALNES